MGYSILFAISVRNDFGQSSYGLTFTTSHFTDVHLNLIIKFELIPDMLEPVEVLDRNPGVNESSFSAGKLINNQMGFRIY